MSKAVAAADEVKSLPAGEKAYRWLREAILTARFPEGSFVEEKVVCDEAKVSRTPVREAFQRLAAEHFIDLLPRRGAQVRSVTAGELVETYEMRQLLEIHGFRTVCDKRLAVPEHLSGHLDHMEELSSTRLVVAGDRDAIVEHARMDFAFHFAMVRATGNTVLTELFSGLESRHQRIGVSAVSLRPQRLAVIGPEHRAILTALEKHDFDTAAATLRQHLRPDDRVVSHLG